MAPRCLIQSLWNYVFSFIALISMLTTGMGQSNGEHEWDIRLAGSRVASEGRVEVYLDGQWGTVMDINTDTWGKNEALVVCKQLGIVYNNVAVLEPGYYGRGTGPVHLIDVSCPEGASSLQECAYFRGRGDGLSHDYDAAVTCSAGIRLEGSHGSDSLNGVIQHFNRHMDMWQPVCSSKWTDANSQVACYQLGYPIGRSVNLRSRDTYTSFYQWDYNCNGQETKLEYCPRRRNNVTDCLEHIYFLTCTGEGVSTDPSSSHSAHDDSTFMLSTISGSLVFLVIVIAVLLAFLIRIKKRGSQHRRWLTLANGHQQYQPSERERRLRAMRTRLGGQRRTPPDVYSISNGQRGNDDNLPSYSRLDEDTPPPYSQMPIPRIEIPIVGRDERYDSRRPRYMESDAIEYFQELDASELRSQYENAAARPSQQQPTGPRCPPYSPPDYTTAVNSNAVTPQEIVRSVHGCDLDAISEAASISSDDDRDDISLSSSRNPISVVPKDSVSINVTTTSVET